MKKNAIILTNGLLAGSSAKTAHGLIRSSDRFHILGVIDPPLAGKDAGEVTGEESKNIPIFDSLKEALNKCTQKIDYAIIGVAPKGGKLPSDLRACLKECLENNISLISGLHDFISDIPELVLLAKEKSLTITDIRKPKDRNELHFWNEKIFEVKCPVVAVLGMDTNMGKRTMAKLLRDVCRKKGIKAEMVFTGQTGWLQDGKYGFILDTTVNDFVSGELAYWVCKCAEETNPDVIFIEGQSGLRNPSGPCGSELLVSAHAKHTILVFSPKRKYYGDNNPAWGEIPSIESEMRLIEMYGSQTIALVINTKDCTLEEAKQYQHFYAEKTGLPVLLPLEEGIDKLLPAIRELKNKD